MNSDEAEEDDGVTVTLAKACATHESIALPAFAHSDGDGDGEKEGEASASAASAVVVELREECDDSSSSSVGPSDIGVFALSDVSLREVVGTGTFAAVHRAEHRGRQIAVKLFNAKASPEALAREIAVLAALRHPNVVAFAGVAWNTASPERPALLMEFCAMGSLFQALHARAPDAKTRRGALSAAPSPVEAHRRRIALGVARAMAHVHARGFAHFDLCSANVLLSADYAPKIADFGQARRAFGIGFPAVGHEAYRAPELCAAPSRNYGRSAHWSEKADVYSYGLLLWELLHRALPWAGCVDIPRQVRDGARPAFGASCPAPWREIVRACWADCPQDRPPFPAIAAKVATLSLPGEDDSSTEDLASAAANDDV